MNRILFLICCITLTSCGLFRKTTHGKSVNTLHENVNQQYVDSSVTMERIVIDTTIKISGTAEQVLNLPIDDCKDDTIKRVFDNERYTAMLQLTHDSNGKSIVKASLRLKPIDVPVKMEKEITTQNHISQTDHSKIISKQINKQVEHTPTINWNWVIPICIVMLLLFAIVFFKTKKLLLTL